MRPLRHRIIDAGTRPVNGCDTAATVLLVTRPCYLALRRAIETRYDRAVSCSSTNPDEPLTATDIEAVLDRPIVATVPYEVAVSRAVDSGLLTSRVPRILGRALRHLVPTLTTQAGDRHARLSCQRRNREHHYRARVHAGAASPQARQCLCPLDFFTISAIGCAAFLLWERLNDHLPDQPGASVELGWNELTRSLGLTPGRGAKVLARLVDFHLVPAEGWFAVRSAAPTLKPAQLERLAEHCPQLAASHDTFAVAAA